MSPLLALWACTLFVVVALALDVRRSPEISRALWIPIVWLSLLASRPLSYWFSPGVGLEADPSEGNPIDRNLLTILMIAALVVLVRRRLKWSVWIGQNKWVFALLFYLAISALWSDYLDVSLKRTIRSVGSVLIILVVLSDKNPVMALAATIRRASLLLIPICVVLIKYFPEYAITYDTWSGRAYLSGVTTDKNALGRLCLMGILFWVWERFCFRPPHGSLSEKLAIVSQATSISLLMLVAWLLYVSNSATSLACLFIGIGVLGLLATPIIHRRRDSLGLLLLLGAALGWAAIESGLVEFLVASLGRNMTFTDRVYIWADLLAWDVNPLFGTGYASFWLGPRREYFISVHQVESAHSGYLDVYVELGYVGLALFSGLLIDAFLRAKGSLSQQPSHGRLRLAILAVFLAYNYTESAYRLTTLMSFLLFLLIIEVPRTEAVTGAKHPRIRNSAIGDNDRPVGYK